MTIDRIVHLIVGVALLTIIILKCKPALSSKDWIILVVSFGLGTWVPDWDLLLGIGFHRSPLTHALFPWLLVYFAGRKFNFSVCVSIGLSIGLASHLLWDIVFYGDVRWISGGNYDRLYLLANSVILLGVGYLQLGRCYNKSKHRTV